MNDLQAINQQLENQLFHLQQKQNESVDSGIHIQDQEVVDRGRQTPKTQGTQMTPRRLQDKSQGTTPRRPSPVPRLNKGVYDNPSITLAGSLMIS